MSKNYTKDIGSNTESPLLKAFGQFIDGQGTVVDGAVKEIAANKATDPNPSEKRMLFSLNLDQHPEEIKNIQKYHITDKKDIKYHYFLMTKPSSSPDNDYSYTVSQTFKEDYRDYKKLVSTKDITRVYDIKNFYFLPSGKQSVISYYDSSMKPRNKDFWGKLSKYLFSRDTLSDTLKLSEDINYLPEYVRMYIPKIQGVSFDSEISNRFYKLSSKKLYSNISGLIDVQELFFYNYLKTLDKRVDVEFNIGKVPVVPLDHIIKDIYEDEKINLLKNKDIWVDQFIKTDTSPNFSDTQTPNLGNLYSTDTPFSKQKDQNMSMMTPSFEISTANDVINNVYPIYKLLESYFNPTKIFQDIVDNKQTPIIPLYYKISKYIKNHKSPEQEFYVPASTTTDLQYIDSQLIPSETHRYSVSLICISAGYSYSILEEHEDKSKEYKYYFNKDTCKFNPVLVELNLIEDVLPSEDSKYPAIPYADILPILGEQNVIKIFLGMKASVAVPIRIMEEENEYRFNIPIPYFSTREVAINSYETYVQEFVPKQENYSNIFFDSIYVHRLEKAPSNYKDFKDARIVSLPYHITEFYDAIENNKKYYYMFRTHDGLRYSNPSEVYEVEIKNVNGAIIPLIKNYSFEEKIENKKESKMRLSFKKKVSIEPSFYQLNAKETKGTDGTFMDSIIDFDRSEFSGLQSIYDNSSGNQSKYKVRLISKLSGKMIDINVRYDYVNENFMKKKTN